MNESAQTLKQQVTVGTAQPAERQTSLDISRRHILIRAMYLAEVVPPIAIAFDAVRHECAVTSPNLRVAGPEESFVPVRPIQRQGERFRGKHGKVTVIRK